MTRPQEIILEDSEARQKKAVITPTGLLAVTAYVKDEVGHLVRTGAIMFDLDQFRKLNDFFYQGL
jgi:hypothetical protein